MYECVSLEKWVESERGERFGRGGRKAWGARGRKVGVQEGRSERNERVEKRERGKVLDRREGELEDYD